MLTPLVKKPNDPLIYDYLSCNLLDHTEETFFKDILQLPAGHTLTIKNGNISIRRYWDLDFSNKGDLETDATYSRDFKELLEDAVNPPAQRRGNWHLFERGFKFISYCDHRKPVNIP